MALILFLRENVFLKSGKHSARVTLLCLLGISIFNVLLFIHGFTHCVIIFILLRFFALLHIYNVSLCAHVFYVLYEGMFLFIQVFSNI